MPITGSLGSLTVEKVSFSTFNFSSWYLETANSIAFSGIASTNSTTYFVGGRTGPYDSITSNSVVNMMCIVDSSTYPQQLWNAEYFLPNVTYTGDIKNRANTSEVYMTMGKNIVANTNTNYSFGTLAVGNLTTSNYDFAKTQLFNPRATQTSNTKMLDSVVWSVGSGICSFIGIDPAANLIIYKYTGINANYGGPAGTIAINSTTYTNTACITNLPTSNYSFGSYVLGCNPTSNNLIRAFHFAGPYPGSTTLVTDWQRQFGSNIAITNVTIDTSDNLYFVTGAKNSNNYIFSYNKTGNLLWQQQINNVQLSSINYSNNYLYICGNTASNVFIAKFDTTGNIQWQTELSSTATTLIPKSIKENNGNIVVAGTSNYRGFVLKIPNTGNIPANGNFILNGSNFTYSNSSLSITTSALSNIVPSTGNVNITNSFGGSGSLYGNSSIQSISSVGIN